MYKKLIHFVIPTLTGLVLVFLLKDEINLALMTVMVSFILSSIHGWLYKEIKRISPFSKDKSILLFIAMLTAVIVTPLYLYLPSIIHQIAYVGKLLSEFNLDSYKEKLDPQIYQYLSNYANSYVHTGGQEVINILGNVWKFSLDLFLAIVLSVIFLMEKEELQGFCNSLEQSKVAEVYLIYKNFAVSLMGSFKKVMEVQIIIAITNSILSMVGLTILGIHQAIGLGALILVLGMVPVAGVLISLVPLTIVAFNTGGVREVIYVLIMIAIMHALESYVLNPKLMSAETKMPTFITFIVLIVSESLTGIWGLLFGMPLFMFFLDILGISQRMTSENDMGDKQQNVAEVAK